MLDPGESATQTVAISGGSVAGQVLRSDVMTLDGRRAARPRPTRRPSRRTDHAGAAGPRAGPGRTPDDRPGADAGDAGLRGDRPPAARPAVAATGHHRGHDAGTTTPSSEVTTTTVAGRCRRRRGAVAPTTTANHSGRQRRSGVGHGCAQPTPAPTLHAAEHPVSGDTGGTRAPDPDRREQPVVVDAGGHHRRWRPVRAGAGRVRLGLRQRHAGHRPGPPQAVAGVAVAAGAQLTATPSS